MLPLEGKSRTTLYACRGAYRRQARRVLSPFGVLNLIRDGRVVDISVGDLLQVDILLLDLFQVVSRIDSQLPQLLLGGFVDLDLVELDVAFHARQLGCGTHLLVGNRSKLDTDLRRALLAGLRGNEPDIVPVVGRKDIQVERHLPT